MAVFHKIPRKAVEASKKSAVQIFDKPTDLRNAWQQMEERFGVILAGGSGTRFWPLSRNERPKQLLDLFGEGTLLAQAVRRLEGLIPLENTLILTNELQRQAVREAVPELPEENIVAEPAKRDTAPAVALGIGLVARRNPGAEMAILPADHLVRDRAEFRRILRGAMDIARVSKQIVTIGIKPTWACPGYGYIERGAEAPELTSPGGVLLWKVVRFREKPSPEVAEQFVRQGTFTWNGGMFIWSVETARRELARHVPELAQFVTAVAETDDLAGVLANRYSGLPKTSIDYALMEKLERSYNVEATFDWDDVGSWLSVAQYLPEDGRGNRHRAVLTGLDACNNVVFSDTPQRVALLGVSDLIVVQTADALLIARRSEADRIKDLVEQMPSELK